MPLEEDIAFLKEKKDTTQIGIKTRWAKNISKDIYICEASNIVQEIK